MAQAPPKPALRPYLPADLSVVLEIFAASIAELTGDDYSETQQAAWIASVDDDEAFAARLAAQLTLIATLGDEPAGFGSLKDNNLIDMLYVHPEAIGNGVGSVLCDALERLAAARGATQLKVEASDSARDFFARRGYTAEQRNTVNLGDEWLGNTTMKKAIAAPPPSGSIQ
jgi:putative acetyltransferase